MNHWNQSNSKHLELTDALLDRALSGVTPDADAAHEVELLAAALDVSLLDELDPMPTTLRATLERDAELWMSMRTSVETASDAPIIETAPEADNGGVLRTLTPWLVTAAALLFAFVTWATGRATVLEPSAEAMYTSMSNQVGTIRVPWDDMTESGVSGELIWDPEANDGVFMLDGLEANAPSELQYQLWIFDSHRKEFTEFDAVDGGVFDVETKDGKTYVHINATLEVGSPYLFAVTSEPPGGVVKHVDDGDYRILLVAPVPEKVLPPAASSSCAPPIDTAVADRRGI